MSFTSLDINNISEPSTPTRLTAHDNSTTTDSSSLDTSNESQTILNNDTNHVNSSIKRNESTGQLANGNLKNASQNAQSNAVNAFLSMPCRTLSQLKTVVPYLVDHTIISVEERVSKRLTTKYKVSQIKIEKKLIPF